MQPNLDPISSCRICGNQELVQILDLGNQRLTGVFPKDKESDMQTGPLILVKCFGDDPGVCGLVQLQHSYDPDDLYSTNYGYRSGLNNSMVDHLKNLVRELEAQVNIETDDIVLDIGSNDSTLLRSFGRPDVRLVGVDPTGEKFREFYPANVNLISLYFSKDVFQEYFGTEKAKVITSIAMFYDLETPFTFVEHICDVLDENGIWVFEQSYLPTMLAMNAYDTVCHEHLEYYGLKQIKWILDRSGLKIVDVKFNQINGGSFRVTAAPKSSSYVEAATLVQRIISDEENKNLDTLLPYRQFKNRVSQHKGELKNLLEKLKIEGAQIAGYGASTKGNVLLQYCEISSDELPFVAEINPDKFGKFTPGTGIPIVSEEYAKSMGIDHFLVLPWHFKENILAREREFLLDGKHLIFPLPTMHVV